MMNTNRANVTFIVNELLSENLVREGSQGVQKVRGRKPTFLYVNSQESYAVAVDVRASQTFLMLTDSLGKQISEVMKFPTEREPLKFAKSLGKFVKRELPEAIRRQTCLGIGIVIPGMLDRKTGVVINAPTLGWRNISLLEPLRKEFGSVEVQLENSGKACALSQIWSKKAGVASYNDIVFVSVSDGVGVGVVINGEVMRGKHNTAGEFGHVPLSIDGPLCSCGASGCWEAYISNLATLSRYFGSGAGNSSLQESEKVQFTIDGLIQKARQGDGKALAALQSTARYLGLGLASVINAIDPNCVYIGGEITEAWDLIESQVREAIKERTLTKELDSTLIKIVPALDYPRLRGAVALVTAPTFAAPTVA